MAPSICSMLTVCLVLATAEPILAQKNTYQGDIVPVLRAHCYSCHGDEGQPEGGVNLEKLKTADDAERAKPVWRKVYTALRDRAMPPADEAQPTAEERAALLHWLGEALAHPQLQGQRDPGQPVLRRLTRLEYNNTVRDLLGLETDLFLFPERLPIQKNYFEPERGKMPATLTLEVREFGAKVPVLLHQEGLPGDNRAAHGYTNRGDALSISPLLLEKYLALAQAISEHPTLFSHARLLGEFFDGVQTPRGHAREKKKTALGTMTIVDAESRYAPANNVRATANTSGVEFEDFRADIATLAPPGAAGVFVGPSGKAGNAHVRGDGKNSLRIQLAEGRYVVITPTADLWLTSFATVAATSPTGIIANKNKNAKVYELALRVEGPAPDERITELGLVALSRQKESGPIAVIANYSDGTSTTLVHDMVPGAGAGNTFFGFSAPRGETISSLRVDGSKFSGDFVLLDDLGFVTSGKPIPSTALSKKVHTSSPGITARDISTPIEKISPLQKHLSKVDRIAELLEYGFRRPITEAQRELYSRPYHAALKAGATEEQAIRDVLKALLMAPEFLFMLEPLDTRQGVVRPLDDFELANRLAYFLWASMPDDELRKLARAGKLRDPHTLEHQARRMMRDAKARELSESFAVQWLRLNELWAAQPDRALFASYYSGPQGKDTLAAALLGEALLQFETVMIEDRSILEFIAADYAYLNNRLIAHYGLSDVLAAQTAAAGMRLPAALTKQKGPAVNKAKAAAGRIWLRATLPNTERGGLLTCGAVLTLTSLPTRTSTVKRGAWILETVYNRPPPEPTIAVAPLDNRRASDAGKTVRQKLEAHRNHPQCMGCHARIDPPGFALENFDAIGRWRTMDDGLPIDSKVTLPHGRSFQGPTEFKRELLLDKMTFVRGFTEHLLSYALGRALQPFDDRTIEEISVAVANDQFRFSRVVVEIVKSYPFRHTRNFIQEDAR